jgi:hypothetical protein
MTKVESLAAKGTEVSNDLWCIETKVPELKTCGDIKGLYLKLGTKRPSVFFMASTISLKGHLKDTANVRIYLRKT